ncbi:MAG TPA: DUF6265 family protein [Allosphingosinicella sp.]|jgi:hypothetical protein
MGKALAALLAMFLSTGFSIPMPPVAHLGWLSGHWMQTSPDGGWTEEYWTQPRGEVMLGTGLSGRRSQVKSFEFMRIQGETFWGAPQGQTPVAFRLVEQGLKSVAFENPGHDYPTRISYRMEGKSLVAITSGPRGANARTWRYRRVRD